MTFLVRVSSVFHPWLPSVFFSVTSAPSVASYFGLLFLLQIGSISLLILFAAKPSTMSLASAARRG